VLESGEKNAICGWVDGDATLKLKDIVSKVFENFNKRVSISTVDRVLKQFHYSIKNLVTIPVQRNTPEAIIFRQEYARGFYNMWNEFDGDNIFFLDESGFQVSMRRKMGRSLRGKIAHVETSNLRTKNLSLCGVINKNGVYLFEVLDNPYNTEKFVSFITNFMQHLTRDGFLNCKIVMDNVAFHKVGSIRNIIEESGHSIVFLPPYSPFLNPIENVFSKWKSCVIDARVVNERDLIEKIGLSAGLITRNDILGYIRKMNRMLLKCIEGEEIFE
jgi:transposase